VTYRLAIFDFDGTLADSLPWFAEIYDQLAGEFGLRRVGRAEREDLRSRNSREIMARVGVAAWQLPRIAHRLRRMKAQQAARIELFPGVGELLRDLARRGVRRAIVSSDAEANIRATLGPDQAALIEHWDCGAGLFGKSAKLRRVVRRSGLPAAAALYVGDELRDGEAARAAGIGFGAVAWGYATTDALRAQAPDRLFTSIAEIAPAFG
jgi:phosphoglycolate phosphatase